VVMDTLGIDVDATDGDNLRTFKRMNNETDELTYDEAVVWFENSDAEQDKQERQMPRLGGMCGGIRATTRHRRW
jgi:hypothetical protein